jgi:hypothetical protein
LNPRLFCKENGYFKAILLTYNFDPLFFERVILKDLWAGETGDILVIADASQIALSIPRWRGQLRYLGRRYQLISANTLGTFHPKMILRFGHETARLWIGSGNITFGGWGGNQELASDLTIENWQENDFFLVLLKKIGLFIPERFLYDNFADILNQLQADVSGDLKVELGSTILMSYENKSLSTQLLERWKSRRFDKVQLLTGSTDENGAFLLWLHENFGVKNTTIIVDQNHVSFSPQKLQSLPLKIVIKYLKGAAPIHAKFYWLEGKGDAAAIMGSANCSAAAWLLEPNFTGNIESIIVYDNPDKTGFAPILEKFSADNLIDANLSLTTKPPKKEKEPIQIGTPEVNWEESQDVILISFPWSKIEIVKVTIKTEDVTLDLLPKNDSRLQWEGNAIGLFSKTTTIFVDIVIKSNDQSSIIITAWVNELSELKQASGGRKITETLIALSQTQKFSEHNKILAEVQRISYMLLSDTKSFPDPIRITGKSNETDNDERQAKLINSEEFIRTIEENPLPERIKSLVHSYGGNLSLHSVLKAFFGAKKDFIEDEEVDEDEENLDTDKNTIPNESKKSKKDYSPPNNQSRKQLYKTINSFIGQLNERSFSQQCTATQMLHAITFPLAVVTLGKAGGWIDNEAAVDWTRKVFDIVFTRKQSLLTDRGLLSVVKARYDEIGEESEFLKIVGDGTLWVVLLSSLETIKWTMGNGSFQKALALRSVFLAKDLIASSNTGRISQLLALLDEEKISSILNEAMNAVKRLHELEAELDDRFYELMALQSNSRPVCEQGDLLWIKNGWAEVCEPAMWGDNTKVYHHLLAEEKLVKTSRFINVTDCAKTNNLIGELLHQLQSL